MYSENQIKELIEGKTRRWLVTGGAGFIGSHLVQTLLELNQEVVSLDNISTGRVSNIEELLSQLDSVKRSRFTDLRGDLANSDDCARALDGVEFVLHQGALGSVPRSIEDPITSTIANVLGFVQLADSVVKQKRVSRFVYASSSSVYGDLQESPKVEARTGDLLSPYAATKRSDEMFAQAFARLSQIPFVGLRYFNVFGPRQDPEGQYAAVIPRWIGKLVSGERCPIYGDGSISRDFCYVQNVVFANLRAALVPNLELSPVYNIAASGSTSLITLYEIIRDEFRRLKPRSITTDLESPEFSPPRVGDIQHSLADISRAERELGYRAEIKVAEGLKRTVEWFIERS